jgi:hypothetical protein
MTPEDVHENNWFSDDIAYEGEAVLTYTEPTGTVEGPAKVTYDDRGHLHFRMDPDNVSSDELFMRLVSDSFGDRSICQSIDIDCEGGKLTFHEQVKPLIHWQSGESGTRITEVRATASRFSFRQTSTGVPIYWVLPLQNFTVELTVSHVALDNHPLRLRALDSGALAARPQSNSDGIYVNRTNPVLAFASQEGTVFVEPLPDYAQRQSRLLNRQAHTVITAVMVGSIGTNDIEDANTWLPFDVLLLIALASGVEVGVPWVEFRDADGGLVRRDHFSSRWPSFTDGSAIIAEDHANRGYLGPFLSQALHSAEIGSSLTRVLLHNLVRAGSRHRLSIEEKLMPLFQCVDALCIKYGLAATNLTANLDINQRSTVKIALSEAAATIEKLCTLAGVTPDQQYSLMRIAERARAIPPSTDNKLRTAAPALISLPLFSFPDVELLNAHYAAHPGPRGAATWGDAFSIYRNAVTHDGYLDFQGGAYDFEDTVMFFLHLHDVTIRMVLKMLDYTDDYESPASAWRGMKPVDWVTSQTSVAELGYR